jgi:hypothetical protein
MTGESVAAAKPVEFFAFNASYLINPNTTNAALLDDAQCWIDAAREIVNTLAIELGQDGSNTQADPKAAGRMLWGAFHLLEMADGAIGAARTADRGMRA